MTSHSDEMRDRIIRAAPEHEDTIMRRDRVANRICAERGWDKDDLTIEQILEIRKDPEWQ